MKYVVVYLRPYSQSAEAPTPEDAVRIVRGKLTPDCRVLGCYPADEPAPPELGGPQPPAPLPNKAVA